MEEYGYSFGGIRYLDYDQYYLWLWSVGTGKIYLAREKIN